MLEVADRDVDGDRQVAALALPDGGLVQCIGQHPLGQRADEIGLLGQRHERAGRNQAHLRMAPPDQRFRPHGRAIAHGYLRLVLEEQLVSLERVGQVVQQPQPADRRFAVRGPVQLEGVVGTLGRVESFVRPPEQRGRVEAVIGHHGHPGAGGESYRHALDRDRGVETGQDPPGRFRRTRRVEPGQDHRELVPAEPGHQVTRPTTFRQPAAHLDQHSIADVVAQVVVGGLEPVQIEQHESQRMAGVHCFFHLEGQLPVEHLPVGHPGEVVRGGVEALTGRLPDQASDGGDQLENKVGAQSAGGQDDEPLRSGQRQHRGGNDGDRAAVYEEMTGGAHEVWQL